MKGVTVNAPQRRTTKKAALSNFCLCPVLFEPLFIRTLKENNWGGGDSNRKAALLEEELMGMFKTKKEIYKDEVRVLFILQYANRVFAIFFSTSFGLENLLKIVLKRTNGITQSQTNHGKKKVMK